jgi:uncharacterized membrane protein
MRLLLFMFFLSLGAASPQYDVILVRSDLPFDWIIAQAYAHSSGVPIVTTHSDRLDDDAREQLTGYLRAGYGSLVIIGGEQAISPGIKAELDELGFVTHRISEGDRYGTSARVAMELFESSETAVIANGERYGGLLVAERVASVTKGPILFVKEGSIPPSVAAALRSLEVRKVYLVEEGVTGEVRQALSRQGYEVVVAQGEVVQEGLPGIYVSFALGVAAGVFLVLLWLRLRRSRVRVPYTILTEDEEKVVRAILDNGGELTQDRLPEKTDFSRPKISRIIADLAGRGIITKEPHGRTQKLIVNREFYEEKEI